jgi:ribosomal protein L11 methyltransferase
MSPDRWLELTLRSPALAADISLVLLELGASAVQETDGALVTYFPPPEELDEFLDSVRARLEAFPTSSAVELSWRWQPQKDWETLWRRGLELRKITSRLAVAPSWEPVPAEPGQVLITLDPGMAFGTAEHATTRGCLRVLDSLVEPGSRVADVGAGSGILSIAAALLGSDKVVALEMDGPSCETAVENVARNGVSDRVTIHRKEVSPGGRLPGSPYDGIVANLQSSLIHPLLPAFRGSLKLDGWLVLSGILMEERDSILPAADRAGLSLQEDDQEDGWWTGVFRPISPQS